MRLPWKRAVYDHALADMVTAAQRTDSLDTIVDAIHARMPMPDTVTPNVVNRRYFDKVFREEIDKQFNDRRRPALEIVLNAIDARPSDHEGDYHVAIRTTASSLAVTDSGRGLGLRDMLTYLLTPFMSDKSGLDEIGQFGVGFLSTFNYLVDDPKHTHITFTTRQLGDEGYRLELYATGENASDLRMRITPLGERGPIGSHVLIRRQFDLKKTRPYLRDNLIGIPSSIARISLDKKEINTPRDATWYAQNAPFEHKGVKIARPVGVLIPGNVQGIELSMQGIPVRSSRSAGIPLTVSFPPLVRLVEGRDEFKRDDNYLLAARTACDVLMDYARSTPLNSESRLRLFDSVHDLSMMLFADSGITRQYISRLDSVLFPSRLAFLTDARDALYSFYDAAQRETLFPLLDQNRPSFTVLNHIGPNRNQFINHLVNSSTPLDLDSAREFHQANPDRERNAHLLYRFLHEHDVLRVFLTQVDTPGASPLLNLGNRTCMINTKHPLFDNDGSPDAIARLLYSVVPTGVAGAHYSPETLPAYLAYVGTSADRFPAQSMRWNLLYKRKGVGFVK